MDLRTNDSTNTTLVKLKLKELIDDPMIYKSFVESINVCHLRNGQLFLVFATKNDFKFMKKNYNEQIDLAMQHVFGINSKYHLSYKEEFETHLNEIGDLNLRKNYLNDRYLFSDYIEAKFNAKAIALAKKIIKQKEVVFNPIFIHAASGLGKTHLLHGIGNEINQTKNVCYINPDQFMKKITKYLMESNQEKLNEIIEYYKEFDVLLFDDIQQYGSKTATLNVLFNILNYHIDHNNQIIIAADKDPGLLGGFEERFITRFQGGITEKIATPSIDDLMIIFKEKLIKHNLDPDNWDTEATKFVIRNHSNSIRNIEGAINKIEWNQQDSDPNLKYNLKVVSEIFSNIPTEEKTISADHIINTIGAYYGLNKNDLIGRSRRKNIVLARHIAMWMIRNMTFKTYKEIGRIFKGKDHSTVMSAIEKIDYQIKINETIKIALKAIKLKIETS